MKKKVSIVIPTFNEIKNVPLLTPEIIKYIPNKYDYEIIFVDDDSPDNTFLEVMKLGKKNKKIKGVKMYKRAGLQPSFMAGFKVATGAAVINMDADFQHPPKLIPKLIELWEKGHDLVEPIKAEDKHSSGVRLVLRNLGYKTWEHLTGGVLTQKVSEFRLMDREIVKYIANSHESEIYVRGVAKLAAKSPAYVPYRVGKRKYGKSNFNLSRMLGIFLTGIVSFSTKPLRIALIVGFVMLPISVSLIVTDSLCFYFFGLRIFGNVSLIAYLALLLLCFTIFYLGVLGEYLAVIFREIKKRPIYTIGQTVNISE